MLAALGFDAVLCSRLWASAVAMEDEGMHICVIPGARLPPGTRLPDGFPLVWMGSMSVDLGVGRDFRQG